MINSQVNLYWSSQQARPNGASFDTQLKQMRLGLAHGLDQWDLGWICSWLKAHSGAALLGCIMCAVGWRLQGNECKNPEEKKKHFIMIMTIALMAMAMMMMIIFTKKIQRRSWFEDGNSTIPNLSSSFKNRRIMLKGPKLPHHSSVKLLHHITLFNTLKDVY